jgi:hypothetical protein
MDVITNQELETYMSYMSIGIKWLFPYIRAISMRIIFTRSWWGHLWLHRQIHIGDGIPQHWTWVVWMGMHVLCCPCNIMSIQTLNTKSPRWLYIFIKSNNIKTLKTMLRPRPTHDLKLTTNAQAPTLLTYYLVPSMHHLKCLYSSFSYVKLLRRDTTLVQTLFQSNFSIGRYEFPKSRTPTHDSNPWQLLLLGFCTLASTSLSFQPL